MAERHPCKWRHFEAESIVLCIRWYLRSAPGYRDLEEIRRERGLSIDHTTISRWGKRSAPELEKRCRPHFKTTTDSWRVDETKVSVKGRWGYLYRAIDADGNLVDSRLSEIRDMEAAQKFFEQALAVVGHAPEQVTTDGQASYPRAVRKILGDNVQHRTNKYLNNRLEQDHRGIKQCSYPRNGFGSFDSAIRFCSAFDELRNYLRPRSTMKETASPSEQRRSFLDRLTALKASIQAVS